VKHQLKHETPEDRVKRVVDGLLTPEEMALIQGKLFEHGGELLLASHDGGNEFRYLAPAPSGAEQQERRNKTISHFRRRKGVRLVIAKTAKRQISFIEVNEEVQSAAT
jgi:hypothetical protein